MVVKCPTWKIWVSSYWFHSNAKIRALLHTMCWYVSSFTNYMYIAFNTFTGSLYLTQMTELTQLNSIHLVLTLAYTIFIWIQFESCLQNRLFGHVVILIFWHLDISMSNTYYSNVHSSPIWIKCRSKIEFLSVFCQIMTLAFDIWPSIFGAQMILCCKPVWHYKLLHRWQTDINIMKA